MSAPGMTPEQFVQDLEHPYAWPGGYPRYFLFSDGGACCFKCAKEEQERIVDAIKEKSDCGWRVVACDVNWEDTDLICEHCNCEIESAYGEKKEEQPETEKEGK